MQSLADSARTHCYYWDPMVRNFKKLGKDAIFIKLNDSDFFEYCIDNTKIASKRGWANEKLICELINVYQSREIVYDYDRISYDWHGEVKIDNIFGSSLYTLYCKGVEVKYYMGNIPEMCGWLYKSLKHAREIKGYVRVYYDIKKIVKYVKQFQRYVDDIPEILINIDNNWFQYRDPSGKWHKYNTLHELIAELRGIYPEYVRNVSCYC